MPAAGYPAAAFHMAHLSSSAVGVKRLGPMPDPLLATAEEILIESEHKLPGGIIHARLVAEAAAAVGAEVGMREDHYTLLACAGLLHDIGCSEWPAQLLSKPGRWNADDMLRAQRHPVSGAALLWDIRDLREAAIWVRQHHERADGRGYPDSPPRQRTTPEGRLLAVVEVFAARAMRLRVTAHSSLTLWGQELSDRFNLFDGLALGYRETDGSQASVPRKPTEQASAISVNTASLEDN
jgi:response regulator RpfG family c-di-GMP phosphodiesterase